MNSSTSAESAKPLLSVSGKISLQIALFIETGKTWKSQASISSKIQKASCITAKRRICTEVLELLAWYLVAEFPNLPKNASFQRQYSSRLINVSRKLSKNHLNSIILAVRFWDTSDELSFGSNSLRNTHDWSTAIMFRG